MLFSHSFVDRPHWFRDRRTIESFSAYNPSWLIFLRGSNNDLRPSFTYMRSSIQGVARPTETAAPPDLHAHLMCNLNTSLCFIRLVQCVLEDGDVSPWNAEAAMTLANSSRISSLASCTSWIFLLRGDNNQCATQPSSVEADFETITDGNKQISGSQHSIFDLFDYCFRFNGFLYRLNSYFFGLAARYELLFDLFVDFSGDHAYSMHYPSTNDSPVHPYVRPSRLP